MAGDLTARASASLAEMIQFNFGGKAALTELAGRYVKVMKKWCEHLGFAADDAEDVSQDAWIRLMTQINKFDRSKGPFRAWCKTVVNNLARDVQRKSMRRQAHHDAVLPETIDAQPGREPEPCDHLILKIEQPLMETLAKVAQQNVLACAEPRSRQVFELRFGGMKTDEVATKLGMKPDAVNKAYSRILQRLRIEVARLEDLGPERLQPRPERPDHETLPPR